MPNEDGTFLSNLNPDDTLIWLGGGGSQIVNINDPTDADWDEAEGDQVLDAGVTFGGTTYAAGTPLTPNYTITFEDGEGVTYVMSGVIFSNNLNPSTTQAVVWQGNIPPPGTELTVISESNPTRANALDYTTFVTCFESGVPIDTEFGPIPAGEVEIGMRLPTVDGALREVLWTSQRRVCRQMLETFPRMQPVLIPAGSLGPGVPLRSLLLSPDHRVMLNSRIALRRFGTPNVMVAARFLVGLPGIRHVIPEHSVEYVHFLLAEHSAISACGLQSESLYLGKMTLRSLSPMKRRALTKATERHGLEWATSRFRFLKRREAEALIATHTKNGRPLVEPAASGLDLKVA
ncbi:Type I secretion target repeat protein [Candidatus Rhodobacter oscarellae]|uniref:Type I secretion target repeat protein n=1 Tax=Candidatus Rhodobacter oscarellae TaxID=1675527 RepID=A0A0J9GWD6_9RHOB|nr:Type I secretion target repeat protein [Candidatus Rhodobacter lobularis]